MAVTLTDAVSHRLHVQPFGQSNPKVENFIMLCSDLPPRIYESLKTLCCLANATRPLQAHEIAAVADLPSAQTAKILQMMTWAGFVKSRRGTKGGFWLVRQPETIRVTDVADFFAHHDAEFRSEENDALLKALEGATAHCREEFSRITVADLAKISGRQPARAIRADRKSSAPLRRKPKQMRTAA